MTKKVRSDTPFHRWKRHAPPGSSRQRHTPLLRVVRDGEVIERLHATIEEWVLITDDSHEVRRLLAPCREGPEGRLATRGNRDRRSRDNLAGSLHDWDLIERRSRDLDF